MLDRIQSSNSEQIVQSQSLDRISGYGVTNPIDNDKNYFIDQSEISTKAFEKYQREEDVKNFSKMLLDSDESEANNLVISKVFNGDISLEDDIYANLLDNDDFVNDVY